MTDSKRHSIPERERLNVIIRARLDYPRSVTADYREAVEALDALTEMARERDRLEEQFDALESENLLLRETVRVFEESQIPMVPRAAQKRLDALSEALSGIAENGACASDARVARDALGDTA